MSHLSYMEKLLDGAEVEWKVLEDVAFFANGKGHEKVITENGNYIVVKIDLFGKRVFPIWITLFSNHLK